jgi:hypothetical protein
MAHPDADKDAGGQPKAAVPSNDPEKPIWHRPSVTKIPVKDIVLASAGSAIDGASGSDAG